MESTSQRQGGVPLVLVRLVIQLVTNRKGCRVYGTKLVLSKGQERSSRPQWQTVSRARANSDSGIYMAVAISIFPANASLLSLGTRVLAPPGTPVILVAHESWHLD